MDPLCKWKRSGPSTIHQTEKAPCYIAHSPDLVLYLMLKLLSFQDLLNLTVTCARLRESALVEVTRRIENEKARQGIERFQDLGAKSTSSKNCVPC